MSDFFWVSGHLGWGLFSLIAFTFLWVLLFDLVWRLRNTGSIRLATAMSAGWAVGFGLILLAVYVGHR